MRCPFLVLHLLLAAGCSASQGATEPGDPPFRIPVSISASSGEVIFQSEIADTPAERQKGLMFREHMGEQEGMVFLFPDEAPRAFWMHNTLIPLDMVFIRADRTVLGVVENAEPKTDTSRSVPGSSQFVLEINGGTAKRVGIAEGQKVTFMAPIPSS